jgi:hypothetical protein
MCATGGARRFMTGATARRWKSEPVTVLPTRTVTDGPRAAGVSRPRGLPLSLTIRNTEMKLGFLEKAERADLSATPATYETDGAVDMGRYAIIISADRAFHLERNRTASADSSLRVPANQLVAVSVWGVDTLSYVLATGEADGGSIYLARTDSVS